jgi:hypothetical protein
MGQYMAVVLERRPGVGRQYHGRRKGKGSSKSFQLEQTMGRLFMRTRKYIKNYLGHLD